MLDSSHNWVPLVLQSVAKEVQAVADCTNVALSGAVAVAFVANALPIARITADAITILILFIKKF
jgi:hypothetical protein